MPQFRETFLAVLKPRASVRVTRALPANRVIACCGLLLLALAPLASVRARACGPDFPNAYLADGSVSLLNAPEGYFAAEIARLANAQKDLRPDTTIADKARAALIAAANAAKRKGELTETGVLRLELAKRGVAPARVDALAAELEAARASIFAKAWDKPPAFSEDMPAEFALYLTGAFYYWKEGNEHRAARETARDCWTKLLALPENERRHHTVNAAYMLGRMNFSNDTNHYNPGTYEVITPDYSNDFDAKRESPQFFRKAREAIAAGFDDPDDLLAPSLGWEARASLETRETRDYAKAIHLYMRQYAALGDADNAGKFNDHNGQTNALTSLRITASAALEYAGASANLPGETCAGIVECLQALAQDELSRRVVTVYLLARFGGYANGYYYNSNDAAAARIARQSRAWAAILQTAGLRDVPDADRIAWIAYQAGNFDMARQWVDIAPQDSVPANWIRAKLALRDGNTAGGESLLEKVTASADLTGDARPVAWSELGRVRMGRGKYAAALDAFIRGGHWEDSAYIAERVLTLDELRAYVDKNYPSYNSTSQKTACDLSVQIIADNADDWSCSPWITGESATLGNALRYLLARRLARANQPDTAVTYFPKKLLTTYTAYIADVRLGFDSALPEEKRARAFWRAALAIHEDGMELLGAELAPDAFIWGGSFTDNGIADARKNGLRFDSGPAAPTADELKRLDENIVPVARYHYRYRAAQLGMWAASLMPNDDDETAAMLNRAGGWLKNRDPKAANDFYRALVIRCPNTALGKAAAKKGWFADAD